MIKKESQNTVIEVPLESLDVCSFNPRQEIDKDKLKELARSISEMGIINPITVRSVEGSDRLEIVCGKRRSLAAVIAKIKTVPCIVRTLTDEEAMELMVTENLQRADVTPMEEAKAFEAIMLMTKMTVANLSAKFGKTEYYIRNRMMLLKLDPRFVELLNTEVIPLKLALEVTKYPADLQDIMWNEKFQDHKQNYWSVPKIKDLQSMVRTRFSGDLNTAAFDITDPELLPETPSCKDCPFNSANSGGLFPDLEENPTCMKIPCFNEKKAAGIKKAIEKVLTEEPDVLIGYENLHGTSEHASVKKMVEEGVPIIEAGYGKAFEVIDKPEPPDPEDEPKQNEFDDHDEFLSAKENFDEEMETYKQNLKEYEELTQGPNVRKMLIVAGNDKGSIVFVKQNVSEKTTSAASANGKSEPITAKDVVVMETIAELEKKHDRNLELCFEKIYLDLSDFFSKSNYTKEKKIPLTKIEWQVFLTMVDLNCFYGSSLKAYEKLAPEPKDVKLDDEVVLLIRKYIQKHTYTATPVSDKTRSASMMMVVKERFLEMHDKVTKEHTDVYNKRNANIKAKIKELTPKKEEPKKEPAKKPETKQVVKKDAKAETKFKPNPKSPVKKVVKPKK